MADRSLIRLTISSNINNYSLESILNITPDYIPGKSDIILTIAPNVVVSSTSTKAPAMLLAGTIDGDTLHLVNHGLILGCGGDGGSGNKIDSLSFNSGSLSGADNFYRVSNQDYCAFLNITGIRTESDVLDYSFSLDFPKSEKYRFEGSSEGSTYICVDNNLVLSIGSSMHTYSSTPYILKGVHTIRMHGVTAGIGLTINGGVSGNAGSNGGDGLHINRPVAIQNRGIIAGGGGGGGAGSGNRIDTNTSITSGSGGGGIPYGKGGNGINKGYDASLDQAGLGGTGIRYTDAIAIPVSKSVKIKYYSFMSGDGGAGGGLGAIGQNGKGADDNGIYVNNGNKGGLAGNSIVGISNATLITSGRILGDCV